MRLHLIETANEIRPLTSTHGQFSSGCWRLSSALAAELVGSEVFFHKHQQALSHFGGRITGYTVLPAGHPCAGRVELHFTLSSATAGKGICARHAPWGREKALVRDLPLAA